MTIREFRSDTLNLEEGISALCAEFLDKYKDFDIEISELSFHRYELRNDDIVDECAVFVQFNSPMADKILMETDWSGEKTKEVPS